jgi:hypothetical protein
MAANCESSSYQRHATKADDKNSVWYYFLQGGDSGKCNVPACGKIIKTVGEAQFTTVLNLG